VEESFELEAPFEASPRLSAADPSLLRPLPLDVTLDGTIDQTAPTLPGSSAPRAAPPAPVTGRPEQAAGRRGLPPVAVGRRPEPAVVPPPAPLPAVARPSTPRSAPPPAATPETAALSSSTLAELYFRQGFLDKAIEVYQQLLQREPDNERSRARLGELRALQAPSVPPTVPPAAPAPAEDERSTRRRAIESAIARLENLLVTIRRNSPVAGPR